MNVLKYVLTIYAVIQSIFIIMWCIGLLHWETFLIFTPTWIVLLAIEILPFILPYSMGLSFKANSKPQPLDIPQISYIFEP